MELFRFRPPLPERSPRSRPNCWRKRGNSLSYASRSISQWKSCATRSNGPDMYPSRNEAVGIAAFAIVALAAAGTAACSRGDRAEAGDASAAVSVGVTRAIRMPLERRLTLSSELVPFQEIDVYAKESGYVRQLNVDYGTRVTQGQLMAVLEIPELQAQLEQDKAAIKNMGEQVTHAEHELGRVEAQHKVAHLQFQRLNTVSESRPGLVAQQEVDDWQGKDLALEAQVEASKSGLQSAQSELAAAQARLVHDQVLADYARITAPFAGVVTERYANLGMLMQAGTTSSTQAMPLVKLSQDQLFRLVIPVPESDVRNIDVGDPVEVRIPSLTRTFPGKVARFSVDVKADTRTMHTEVDVPNRSEERRVGSDWSSDVCSSDLGGGADSVADQDFPRQSGAVFGGRESGHAHHAYRSGCAEPETRTDRGHVRGGHSEDGAQERRAGGAATSRGSPGRAQQRVGGEYGQSDRAADLDAGRSECRLCGGPGGLGGRRASGGERSRRSKARRSGAAQNHRPFELRGQELSVHVALLDSQPLLRRSHLPGAGSHWRDQPGAHAGGSVSRH